MPPRSLVLVSSLLALALSAVAEAHWMALEASSSSECCSTCIGKTSNTVYDYDPVIYAQCSNVTGGICCFDCGDLGEPQYGDTVSYASDGVTAVITAGTYVSFTWSSVVNVTYISLKTGQKKTKTPTISDTAADEKSSTFLICAKAAGTIYFRGWGSDSCREASQEYSVTVEAGDSSTSTCDASDVTVTTASSAGGDTSNSVAQDDTVAECNAQRASVQVVDGTQTCVCVSDWTNPPECDQWPIWKWLVTVGGGVAALFSIIISVRAFLQGRKKKQEAEDRENLAPMGSKSDVETLEVTPDSGYHSNAAFKYDPEADRAPGGARKADDREFTL
ncbi:hypothetical protein PHYSODRAFT_564380 [Phytophthora sojae]|uniref:Uncharacterized protein n=1 Tax=Phytophthora sojae (strain P6497) TaxID=1094619 RepID=G5A2T4_PHYSP|nr:hypothetical protein PHYSODRAFT_564380 [Phytophthora sojae]EGZ09974.1 hypothetical protein PHYSODRAFT_564380 [Phytophthora sojae]|eukprot:XP_009534835.1 hypothetical protein PHYSODRAFT_564380 [Phytophthora sojae]